MDLHTVHLLPPLDRHIVAILHSRCIGTYQHDTAAEHPGIDLPIQHVTEGKHFIIAAFSGEGKSKGIAGNQLRLLHRQSHLLTVTLIHPG